MSTGEIIIIIGAVLLVLLIIVLLSGIRIVKQTDAFVIQRLGAYHATWSVGIHFLIPFIDRVEKKVSLREQVRDYPPQPVITSDNVTMQIDTVVFYQVSDPKLFTYGVQAPDRAIENLTATTLRNIIGELDLDQTLTSRDIINNKIRNILDEATDSWGLKVTRVEVRNIVPPADIKEAMEKQMRAEREKRQSILRAQGEKESAILRAEGEKKAVILRAEAQKEEMIRIAEGERQRKINEAEGNAESIILNAEAEAKGIEAIKNAQADHNVIALRSLEALKEVANGQATTVIVPSQIQDLAGAITSIGALIGANSETPKGKK